MELGIYTFGETTPDPAGRGVAQRLRDLIEEIVLADQVGLEVFGVGEHHRPDFTVSAPAVVLAAAAERTKKIRLTSAVTVLSSDDPVRVFQNFATLDLLSGGRAEIMAGRGSFLESFPLFGYALEDYDELFSEKLELLLELRDHERVTWSGKHRAPLNDLAVYPRPQQNPLPIWIAVGGTPQSVVRAGMLGLPLALAIIGGEPERFAPLIDLYRNAARRAGHDPARLPVGINSHVYVADSSQQAADEFFPSYAEIMSRIGQERGWSRMTRQQFEALLTARRAAGRQPAGGNRQDPLSARDLRPPTVPRPAQRRPDAARPDPALDRAVRNRGRPGGPPGDRGGFLMTSPDRSKVRPEVWMRGPIPGIPPLLQPVAHALLQALEEVCSVVVPLSPADLWARPGGAASVGFHVRHAAGSLDRLFTYARGEALTAEQFAFLAAEGEPGSPPAQATALVSAFEEGVDRALAQLRETPEATLLEPRGVGRRQLPSTVLGLLFHAAEHTQRHVGQIVTTTRIVQALDTDFR